MDTLIVGLIGVLALVYVANKIYKQITSTTGCGCGGCKSADKNNNQTDQASSGCGCSGNCGGSDNSTLGLKPVSNNTKIR